MPTKTRPADYEILYSYYWCPVKRYDYDDEDDRLIVAGCLLLLEALCWVAWIF